MDELSPRARALLEAAHGTDDPLAGDAARVRRSVMTRIGSTGLGAAVFSLSLERAKALLGVATPKVVALMLIAVAGSAVYQRLHAGEQRPSESSSAPVTSLSLPASANVPPAAAIAAPPVAVPLSALPILPRRPLRRAMLASPQAIVAPPDPSDDLEAEMRCVRAADAALRNGNVGEAEGLLDEHAREFPSGRLAEERDGLRIVAACQSGDSDAPRAAAQFLERAPRSLLAGRVRSACTQPNSR